MLDTNCGWEEEHNCENTHLRHVTVCVSPESWAVDVCAVNDTCFRYM